MRYNVTKNELIKALIQAYRQILSHPKDNVLIRISVATWISIRCEVILLCFDIINLIMHRNKQRLSKQSYLRLPKKLTDL